MALAAVDFEDGIGAAIDRLASDGFAVLDDFVPPALVAALAARLHQLEAAEALATAGIGRDGDRAVDRRIRRAAIRWFDGRNEAERGMLDLAESLRLEINRQLFLGLFHFECHFIAYPVGGFYRRHLDSLAGSRNRIVSLATYLDPGWTAEDGGALRIWRSREDVGPPAVDVVPLAGRAVLMLSEEIPHEVLPTNRPRHAIAGWWRVAGG